MTIAWLVILVAAIVGFFFLPWLAFWAIGTLFGHHIAFTFWTWLAAWVLMFCVNGGNGRSR